MSLIAVLGNWHAQSNAAQYSDALEDLGHSVLRIGPRFTELDGVRWFKGLMEMEWPPTNAEADAYVGKVLAESLTPDIETEKGAVFDEALDVDAAIDFWAYGETPVWTEAKVRQHHAVVFGDTHTSHLQDQVAQVRNGHYDSVFVQFRRSDLAAFNHPSKHWLPAAADPIIWRPYPEVEKDIDVLFVGSTHPQVHRDRVDLIRYLQANGIGVTVKHAFGSDAARLMARAKVVLHRSLAGDLAMRVPESLSCGAVLVTDNVDGLTDVAGGHYLGYGSQAGALARVRMVLGAYAVNDPPLTAAEDRAHIVGAHTYEHRARFLLTKMGLPEEGNGNVGRASSASRSDVRDHAHVVDLSSCVDDDAHKTPLARPSVSIIIPAFNKWELTSALIDVLDMFDRADVETIIVDDGSTDATAHYDGWEPLNRRVLHKSNGGFCSAVNYGVKHAKGKYVVILNNDTTPEAGWLAPLIEELENGAGIVGSQILNPDGSVQATGLWQLGDGTWCNNSVVRYDRYLRVIGVPSIQGACFAMRRDTFLRLGGLDEVWGNGGCCEVDLSLRVAKEGLPVCLRLDSKVTHAEGSTRFHTEGIQEKIAENTRRLIERWGMPDVRNGDADSGRTDVSDSGGALGRVPDVSLSRGDNSGRTNDRPLTLVWDGPIDPATGGSLGIVNKSVIDALRLQDHFVFHGIPSVASITTNGKAPDAHVTHYWPGLEAHTPPNTDPKAWVVIQPYEIPNPPPNWAQTWAHPKFRLLITPSAYSERLFLDAFPELQGKTKVIPNGVDTSLFTPEGPKAPGRDDLWRCLFVGGLLGRKGVDLLYEAWRMAFAFNEPAILLLKTAGRDTFYKSQFIDPPSDIKTSVIDRDMEAVELASVYRKADCVIAPYRYEGFCMPLLEGMASGKPVIHSDQGPSVEFVPPSAGLAIPSVNHEIDVTSLARGIRWLYEHRSEGESMGQAGREAAMAYSWDKVASRYAEAIRRVCA